MRVSELIAELNALDPQSDVYFDGASGPEEAMVIDKVVVDVLTENGKFLPKQVSCLYS